MRRAAVLAVVLAVGSGPGVARGQGSFRGVAAAEGVRVGLVAGGAPVANQVVDGASPIAQAELDSTNGSSAFASLLYPGDVVVTTPGLLAGFSGGQTSDFIGPYPLIAIAGSTTVPESSVEAPGGSMRARGTDRQAAATTTAGPAGQPGETATVATAATVERHADDTVVAQATSTVASATIGPVVLGRVTARSVATRDTAGTLTRESSFDATGITVDGVGVKLTPDGLLIADTNVPVSASPLQPVLDEARVSLRYVAAEHTEDGVISAGLVVSRVQELPGSITPVAVSTTFGRASAGVSGVALGGGVVDGGPLPSPGDLLVGVPGPADAEAPAGTDVPVAGRVPVTGAPVPLPGVYGPVGSGSGPETGGPGAGAPQQVAAPEARPALRGSFDGSVELFDASGLYLVLVAGALSAGMVLELLRRLGVTRRWT